MEDQIYAKHFLVSPQSPQIFETLPEKARRRFVCAERFGIIKLPQTRRSTLMNVVMCDITSGSASASSFRFNHSTNDLGD